MYKAEKVIETWVYKKAVFELVEKPETIYAGTLIYADSLEDVEVDLSTRLSED